MTFAVCRKRNSKSPYYIVMYRGYRTTQLRGYEATWPRSHCFSSIASKWQGILQLSLHQRLLYRWDFFVAVHTYIGYFTHCGYFVDTWQQTIITFSRQKSACWQHCIIGSFSNDDGDGDEDVKKAIGLLRKTTTLHVHHAFCTFLYRPCTTTTWKCLIASFMEDVNKQRRISFSLSELECGPQKSQLQGNSPTLAIFSKLE